MGELKVGDLVFDEAGKVCRTTWVSGIEVPEEAYRFTFSDNSTIDSCSEHQWVTWTHAERKAFLRSPYEETTDRFPDDWPAWRLKRMDGSWRFRTPQSKVDEARELIVAGMSTRKVAAKVGVSRPTLMGLVYSEDRREATPQVHSDSPGPQIRTTKQIVDTMAYGGREDRNHCIPQCGSLDLGEAELPIPAYTFGAWLGDGSRCGAAITQHQDDQDSLVQNIEADGYKCSGRSDPQTIGILGLFGQLHRTGVWKNKHVPSVYLRGSESQRLSLLQGLMDTDGGVEAASMVSFCNGNTQIADAVYELVVSLGMKATRGVRSAEIANQTDKYHWNQDSHRITFTPTMQVFRLPRKANRISFTCDQQLRRHHRMIVSAERIDSTPMRCITVDSPNSMYLAGRQMVPTHNTRTGAEDFARFGLKNPGSRLAVIASTYQGARDVCIEGESGLLACIPDKLIRDWNRSIGELSLLNGSQYRIFTGEKPSALRGPQHHRIWCDEIASWKHPEDTWDMAQFGLRLGKTPQNIVTTTPQPVKIIRDLIKDKNTVISTGSTFENRENLPPNFFEKILAKYEGTRLGLQELYAQVLDDIPGALWQRSQIEHGRLRKVTPLEVAKRCRRVVVAIDPAVTSPKNTSSDKEDNDMDETGIVVVGIDADGKGYVLADESCRVSPLTWAGKAIKLYKEFGADRVIGEANNGGDLVEEVIRVVDPNVSFRKVIASRGKYVRAEPIAALYEQGRVHHVGLFEKLEDQMCTFTPENIEKKSPDRADALVWGMTDIFDGCMNLGLLQWQRENPRETAQAITKAVAQEAMHVCGKCQVLMTKAGNGYRCCQCGAQMGSAAVFANPVSRTEALRSQSR